jgi:DNA mismatch endonuclease (patch repair protein)
MDTFEKEKRSEIMSKVRSKETKIEKDFRKKLWSKGLRYRKNNGKLFGKPDISFRSKKTVIFLDSCFWHGCKEHLRMPASNKEYWQRKIKRNIERDKAVDNYYSKKGWEIYRIWEHGLKQKQDKIINLIYQHIKGVKNG